MSFSTLPAGAPRVSFSKCLQAQPAACFKCSTGAFERQTTASLSLGLAARTCFTFQGRGGLRPHTPSRFLRKRRKATCSECCVYVDADCKRSGSAPRELQQVRAGSACCFVSNAPPEHLKGRRQQVFHSGLQPEPALHSKTLGLCPKPYRP